MGKKSAPSDRVYSYTSDFIGISENIASGARLGTPQKTIDGWISSPGHCRNLMDADMTFVGMAHVENKDSELTNYWTQNFGMK